MNMSSESNKPTSSTPSHSTSSIPTHTHVVSDTPIHSSIDPTQQPIVSSHSTREHPISPSKESFRGRSHSPVRSSETPSKSRQSSLPPFSPNKSPFPRDFATPLRLDEKDQTSPMSEDSVHYRHPFVRSASRSPLPTTPSHTQPQLVLFDRSTEASQGNRFRSQSHPQTFSPCKEVEFNSRKRSRSESGGSVSSVTWNRFSGLKSITENVNQDLDKMDVDPNIPDNEKQSTSSHIQNADKPQDDSIRVDTEETPKPSSPSLHSAGSGEMDEKSPSAAQETRIKSEPVSDREVELVETNVKPVRKRGPGRPPGSRNRTSTTWESAQITKLKEFETRKKPIKTPVSRKPKKKQESSSSESSSSDESDRDRSSKKEEGIMLPDRKRVLPFSAINHPDRSGRTAIYKYAMTGDAGSCKRLIEAGARLNLRDHAGWTPLHEACLNGHLNCAEIILAAGANINAPGGDMDTPLHDAAQNGHFEIVQFLLAHGASPLSLNAKKETPIDVADDSVKRFLEEWEQTMEDLLKRDESGRCSLHVACEKGDVKSVRVCLQYGVDVNNADYAGWTPLHEAALHGHSHCMQVLLEYGAQVNILGYQDETPLMDAVIQGHVDCVQLLLQYGANPDIKNAQGKSAFDKLSDKNRETMERFLNGNESVWGPAKRPKFVSRPVAVSDQDSGPHTPRHARSHSIGSDSTQSALSHHRKKKNDLFPWWGNLNENQGEFSSTREERKFKALLKSLETSAVSPSGKSITKKRKIYGQVTYSEDEGGFDIVAAADGEGLVCKEHAPRRASSSGRDASQEASASNSPTQSATPAVKRKRGRPRKNRDEDGAKSSKPDVSSDEDQPSKPKRTIKEKLQSSKERSASPVPVKKVKLVKEEKGKEKPKPTANEEAQEIKQKKPVKEEKAESSSLKTITTPESVRLALAEQKEEMERKAKAKEKDMAVHSAAVAAATALKRASVGEIVGDKSPIRKKPKLFQGLGGYINANVKPNEPKVDSKEEEKKEERRVSTGSKEKSAPTVLDKERDSAAIQNVFNSLNPENALKKSKKKNWMGLAGHAEDTPKSPEALKRSLALEQAIETLKKRRCIPLYVVTLPIEQGSSTIERYLVDLQVGLCLGLKSGRALLEKYPEMSRRLATASEKSSLEISPVAESILNCMMGKRSDSVIPKWIKWVVTSSGGKGLKLTDVDIHFVPEAEAIKRISPAWMAEGSSHTVPIYGDGKPVFETTEPVKLPDRLVTLDMDLSMYPSKLTVEDRMSMDSSKGNQSPAMSDSTRRDSTVSTRTEDAFVPPLPHRDSTSSLMSSSPVSAVTPSGPSSDAAYYLHKLKRPPKKQFGK